VIWLPLIFETIRLPFSARWPDEGSDGLARQRHKYLTEPMPDAGRCFYFFLPDPNEGCQPAVAPFWLGAAAIVLIFSFFGFFDSRFPFCSPLAMPFSLVERQATTPGYPSAAYYPVIRVSGVDAVICPWLVASQLFQNKIWQR
jgi:hypothetical protein